MDHNARVTVAYSGGFGSACHEIDEVLGKRPLATGFDRHF